MSQEKMATNMSVRAVVDSILEIMGTNGAKVIFRDAGYPQLLENPPDYNWDPCVSTSDQARFMIGVADVVGLNGAVGIWRRIGYTGYRYANEIGHIFDSLTDLSADEKFVKALELYIAAAGRGKVVNGNGKKVPDFEVPDCHFCDGITAERSICSGFAGVVQYVSDWAYGKGEYIVKETECRAKGDKTCYFTLSKSD
jgi:predicted hydrocarbon binding protein